MNQNGIENAPFHIVCTMITYWFHVLSIQLKKTEQKMCAPKIKFKVKIISCSCIIGLTLLVFYFGGAILHLIDLKYRNYTVSQPLTREQFISGLKHITSMGIRNKSFKARYIYLYFCFALVIKSYVFFVVFPWHLHRS
jgi:hypothetical protein